MTTKDDTANLANLIPVQQFYAQAESQLGIKSRTIQWYVTEKLLPKPIHVKGEAYYDPTTNVGKQLKLIQLLQKELELKLYQVKQIVDKYGASDWSELIRLVDDLVNEYPQYSEDDWGELHRNVHNQLVAQRVLSKLYEGKATGSISLLQCEEEADKNYAF